MPALRRLGQTVVAAVFLLLAQALVTTDLQAQGGVTTMAVCGHPGQPPCPPHVYITNLPSTPIARGVDQNSLSYTITVFNNGTVAGLIDVSCTPTSNQTLCEPSPSSLGNVDPGQSRSVTINYSTLGIGSHGHKIRAVIEADVGGIAKDSQTVMLTVTGPPMVQHLSPAAYGPARLTDSVKATYYHSSGINTSSVVFKLDGATNSRTTTASGYSAGTLSSLNITAGMHTWNTYLCANNGRCDSYNSTIEYTGPPAIFHLDDSMAAPVGAQALYTALPGALPLPSAGYRGCPATTNSPEIRLTSPTSYISQPGSATGPSGLIFWASVNSRSYIDITTLTIDHVPADNRTCANFTYLNWNQYDWGWWNPVPATDTLWRYYPYGDKPGAGGGGAFGGSMPVYQLPGAPPVVPRPGGPLQLPTGPSRRPPNGPTPNVVSAGAINTNSLNIWINEVQVVTNGTPASGVTINSVQQYGQSYRVPITYLHQFSMLNPTSDNGGWNEVIMSIADSSGNTTSLQTRFAQIASGPVTPLAYTPLRDFTTHDEGECAAFGPFQCDGLVMTQTIPGFITRDKDRSLHLIYRSASQRGRTIMPYRLFISRHQSAPDSFSVSARIGSVKLPDTTAYLGAGLVSSTIGVGALQQDGDEARLIAAELTAPLAGDSIRNVTVGFRGIHAGNTLLEDQVSQDVVSLTLLDTTQTRFGSGWQLAEFHRLVIGQSIGGQQAVIWALPDGSFTVFRKVGSVWITPKGETAVLYDSTLTASLTARWVIRLDNGASMGFRADGQQQLTEDLIGNKTQFQYTSTRLTRILDPSGMRFDLEYNDATNGPGMVTDVWVRNAAGTSVGRVATFKYAKPSGYPARLRAVYLFKNGTDADSTVFTYDSTLVYGAFVKSITDPRSTASNPIVTNIAWDPLLWRPEAIQEPSRKTGTAGAWALNRDPWRRIAPRFGYGRKNQTGDRLLYDVQMMGSNITSAGLATDVKVDAFGHPTNVRVIAPEPLYQGGFLWKTFGGDDVRRITRDSLGRVLKIVRAPDSTTIADSVMYRYNAYNKVDRVIRTTLQWPIKNSITLDTLSFTYDSVTTFGAGKKCSRMLKSVGVMGTAKGDTTKVVYGGSGVGQCLPARMIGSAADTTIFTYGALTAGDPAGARPISVRDPNGDISYVAYESTWWNSRLSYRGGINDSTVAWYNSWGRPDSVVDAVGKSTQYAYDYMGRVTHQRAGSGSLAPITRTDYAPGGVVTRVAVYANSGVLTAAAVGDSQITRNYYDGLGALDSVANPGRTVASKNGRLQSWKSRDNWGVPAWEMPGNGLYTNRFADWRGRPSVTFQGATNLQFSIDGEPFADATTKNFYVDLDLRTGKQLSNGTKVTYEYDNKGNLKYSDSYDLYMQAYTTRHRMGYSPVGQLLTDTLEFTDSLRVVRRFEYNRRGQRTQVADTVRRLPSGTILPEGTGLTVYQYSDTTGRQNATFSTVLASSSIYIAWIGQYYDRGGRLVLRHAYLGNGADWGTGRVSTAFSYGTGGRLSSQVTSGGGTNPATTWYSLSSPTYSNIDELTQYTESKYGGGTRTHTLTYTTDGTRRLLQSHRADGAVSWDDQYLYDAFGNRKRNRYTTTVAGSAGSKMDLTTPCQVNDTLFYAADNRLLKSSRRGCTTSYTYFNDQTGNRIAQLDTLGGGPVPAVNRMSYTAGNQLYYSLTRTSDPGHYDANWHWYDAGGLRAISQGAIVTTWNPDDEPLTIGSRSFYVYDGSDVALTITRTENGVWSVRQRFMTGGVDQQMIVRSMNKNLVLVSDRSGSPVAGVTDQGLAETQTVYWSRDAFGAVDQGTLAGSINTETGFSGASSPSPTGGGFTYLRNRWYDPQSGRFLTQDPIGLAGGVNLYAYAGNNPIAFADPFGLDPCKRTGNCTQQQESRNQTAFKEEVAGGNIESTVLDPTLLIGAGSLAKATFGLAVKLFAREATVVASKEVATVATKELLPTHGVKLGKKAMERLTADIAENGVKEPVAYVEHEGGKYIVDGHHRWMAAKRLGLPEIPAQPVQLPYKGYETVADLRFEF